MRPIDRDTFQRYLNETEVIRYYKSLLFTFGDMELPYIFAAEHHLGGRVVVIRGAMTAKRPTIMLPGQAGPRFADGFDFEIPPDSSAFFRSIGLPQYNLHNKTGPRKEITHGSLRSVLDEYNKQLERENDQRTGLIKGNVEGMTASLVMYSIGLTVRSMPGNVQEYIEHLRKQDGESIKPGETVTDEDIKRLLSS